MTPMSESFVDLSYRGLALGKRIKLTQVRPATGYLEMPTPMPVGTTIAIATDDGVQLEALVTEVHEQVGGSDRVPGMLVKPQLDDGAASAWWTARASATPAEVRPDKAAPPADADGKVTVKSPRMSGLVAVPEVMDDGKNTAVMSAIGSETSGGVDTVVADLPPVQDDGKRTMMMDAVDLAALGLSSPSGQMPAVKPEDYADADDSNGGPADDAGASKPDATGTGGKAKKKRKRR